MLSEDIIINGKKLWFALLLFEADFFKRYPEIREPDQPPSP
jgi:hypothetical protein